MAKRETPEKALKRAIKIVGGQTTVARALGITYQAVHGWILCPPRRVLALEALTERQVTRYDLRPDLYPRAA